MWEQLKTRLSEIPRCRRYLYVGLFVLGLVYLGWLMVHKPDIKQGQVVTAPPAKAVKNEPVELIKPKQLQVYKNPARVAEKLGLPAPAQQEAIQTTAQIPRLKYGGVSAVYTNTSTGQSRTEIKANAAPWFAFRNDLAVGVGAGIGTVGNTAAGRVRYDVAQIKNITVSGEGEVNYAANRKDPVEGRAMLWLEWRK